ncbi:MAG: FkbM family methyltransferase, partial [Bacteroidales bacterium]|nr:FkbM family methyltransferase [Bacteroidales bacterium]
EMKNPDKLFSEIEKIDFIKCDVEGYESEVFSNMQTLLKKHKPLVQSELSGIENRKKVIEIFENLGYLTYVLRNGVLEKVNKEVIDSINTDFYFKMKS